MTRETYTMHTRSCFQNSMLSKHYTSKRTIKNVNAIFATNSIDMALKLVYVSLLYRYLDLPLRTVLLAWRWVDLFRAWLDRACLASSCRGPWSARDPARPRGGVCGLRSRGGACGLTSNGRSIGTRRWLCSRIILMHGI